MLLLGLLMLFGEDSEDSKSPHCGPTSLQLSLMTPHLSPRFDIIATAYRLAMAQIGVAMQFVASCEVKPGPSG